MQRIRFIFAIDLVLLALLALGIYRASERAAFPLPLETRSMQTDSTALFIANTNDYIRNIDGIAVRGAAETEFFISHYRIADTVHVTLADDRSETYVLSAYYRLPYSIIQASTAFIYALLGLFILMRKQGDDLSRKFHHLTFALAALIAHTTGSFSLPTPTVSVLLEILFHIAYAISGVLFLQFIFTFGRYSFRQRVYVEAVLYAIAFILAAITSIYFANAHHLSNSLQHFEAYDNWLKILRLYFGALFIAGLAVLIHAVRTRRAPALNKQLSWVLYGCTLSIISYIVLWQVPILLDKNDIISEETMLLLSLLAPIAIAIGIVRHKLFDIDLLIKKSISYALLVAVIIGVYIVAVTGITWFTQQFNSKNTIYPAAAAAIIAALLFDPLRRKVSGLVDQKFFRASYDFRQAQRRLLDDIRQALDMRMLGSIVVEQIQQLIPVERIGFFVLKEDLRRMRLVAHQGFDMLERHGVSFTREDIKTGLEHPVALPEFVEETVIEVADRQTFERWKIALVIPMLTEARHPLGFVVLGRRRSETRFTSDDVELLTQVAAQAATVIERLFLQQKLLLEQAESQRLDELNRLKSYFVSSVTHDLKTPLTSIRLYAELLRAELPQEKKSSYVMTIERETERLARLITNVLDFARIEQGTKAYAMRPIDLSSTVRDAVELVQYQIASEGFAFSMQVPEQSTPIIGDRDALIGVIVNLISNALKYSGSQKKCIAVTLTLHETFTQLRIADHGIGMKEEVLQHIFEPFYRVSQHSGSGAGLGLAIVKHTVDAHKATIEVASEPGNGTTFTITFPII